MSDTGTIHPAPVRIIGIGSAAGGDVLGWHAVERLLASGWTSRYPDGLLDVSCSPTPALLPAMTGATRLLILIDALLDGSAPGSLHRLTADRLATDAQASSHGVGVGEALALIEALYGDTLQVVVLGISAGTPDPGAGVDTRLDTAWPSLLAALDEVVRQYLEQDNGVNCMPGATDEYPLKRDIR
ncbi:MAG: hydrogenase maturation protease [Gammaproteobacteria bacterium]